MGSDKEERESFGIAAFKDDIDGTGEIKLFFFPANQTVCCFGFFSFFPTICNWNLLAHTHTHTHKIIVKIRGTRHKNTLHLELDSAKRRKQGAQLQWRKSSSRRMLRRPPCAAGDISQAVPIYLHLPLFAAHFSSER